MATVVHVQEPEGAMVVTSSWSASPKPRYITSVSKRTEDLKPHMVSTVGNCCNYSIFFPELAL